MCQRERTCRNASKNCRALDMGKDMPCYHEARYRCKLCGRDRFNRPMPHNCQSGFVKHFGQVAKKRGMETIWELVK